MGTHVLWRENTHVLWGCRINKIVKTNQNGQRQYNPSLCLSGTVVKQLKDPSHTSSVCGAIGAGL